MFTANSMNCLTEALGLALPGNGSTLATHTARRQLYEDAGRTVVEIAHALVRRGRRVGAAARGRDARRVRERDDARRRDGRLDQHGPAPARRRAGGGGRLHDGRHRRALAPRAVHLQGRAERHVPDGGRPPRRRHPRDPRRAAPRRAAARGVTTVHARTMDEWLGAWDVRSGHADRGRASSCSTPRPAAAARRPRSRSPSAGSRSTLDAADGCIRDVAHAYSADGGLAILYGNLAERGCVVKTAGVDESILTLQRPGGRRRVAGGGGRGDPRRRRRARATWS